MLAWSSRPRRWITPSLQSRKLDALSHRRTASTATRNGTDRRGLVPADLARHSPADSQRRPAHRGPLNAVSSQDSQVLADADQRADENFQLLDALESEDDALQN